MTIRLHEPTFGEDEISAAVAVLRSTQVTQGKKVKEFERAFSPNARAVACNSGSSANLLAIAGLKSLGRLTEGDEVIVSALSWSTTVWPLVQHGLIPVLVDCDPDTLNMDMGRASDAISDKTHAIMPVHVYGNPCDLDALNVLRGGRRLLIEDCCEAMGAKYKGAPVGTGDVSTFSFYFSHHVTTLEGGIAVTKNASLADAMRIQRSHGWIRDVESPDDYPCGNIDPRFLFVDTGYNLRLNEVQAAIGLVQLPKLAGFVEARRAAHNAYRKAFEGYEFFRLQKEIPEAESSCFGFTVVLDNAPFSRKQITDYLNRHDIETRPIICGNLAKQPGMKKKPHRIMGKLRNADNVMSNGFSIGCHQGVTAEDAAHAAQVVRDFVCAL